MSETPESTNEPMSVTAESPSSTKPRARLRQALTWVGIVAGAVIVVAAIFISGAATAWLSGWHDQHRQQACMMDMGNSPTGPMAGDKDCCGPNKGPAQPDCCEPKKQS
jgi:predicted phage tail protein